MVMLRPADGDTPVFKEVRARARELYLRSCARSIAPGEGLPGQRIDLGTPPSRGELDELWSMVPPAYLVWARGLVEGAVGRARASGTTATPQVIEIGDA